MSSSRAGQRTKLTLKLLARREQLRSKLNNLKLQATGEQLRSKLNTLKLRATSNRIRLKNIQLLRGRIKHRLAILNKEMRMLREEARLKRRDRSGVMRILREEKVDFRRASIPGSRQRISGRVRSAGSRIGARLIARRDETVRQLLASPRISGRLSAHVRARLRSALRKTQTSRRSLLQNLLYDRRVVILDEPAETAWFDADGYPLASRDPDTGRFVNPWNSQSTNGDHSFGELWRWRKERWQRWKRGVKMEPSPEFSQSFHEVCSDRIRQILLPPSSTDRIKLTWLGHSTCLIRQHSFTFLTDPMFSDRASPFQFIGPKRYISPALTVPDLPQIDVCLVSHDHYDHLDYRSIFDLVDKGKVKFWVVPLGLKQWLMEEVGVHSRDIVELEWWEGVRLTKNESSRSINVDRVVSAQDNLDKITIAQSSDCGDNREILQNGLESALITCAPSQHWCGRTPFDRNRRLWCSWAVQTNVNTTNDLTSSHGKSLNFYFSGDTGLPPVFPLHQQIGERLGPFDLAAIPIGAYAPSFFMSDSHCNPHEAVKIHCDIESKRSVAIHWGTFALADERYDEPPILLKEAVRNCEDELIKNQASTNNEVIGGSVSLERSGVKNESEDENLIVDFVTVGQGESVESLDQNMALSPPVNLDPKIFKPLSRKGVQEMRLTPI